MDVLAYISYANANSTFIGAKTSNKRTNKLTIYVTEVIPGKLAVHAICDS